MKLVLYGICIHKENESISPVVYPEEFILPYIVGILNAEKIADILLEQCRQREISQEAAAHLDDFGLMKDKVRIRLVNYGANSRELDGIPHRRFLDLAITYYLDMQAALAGQIGAGAITNAMMEIWGASEDELYRLGMEKLLAEEKVAVVPGTAFGECGEGFIRISYAYSLDNLKTALERVQRFIEKLKKGEINKTK